MSTDLDGLPWYADHSNLVTLTAYMAACNYTADDLAYAIEKPWKYDSEFKNAVAWAESFGPAIPS